MSKIKIIKKALTELSKTVKRKPKVSNIGGKKGTGRSTAVPGSGRKKTTTRKSSTRTKPKTKPKTQEKPKITKKTNNQVRNKTNKKTETKTTTPPKKKVDASAKFTKAEKRRQARARLNKTKGKGKSNAVKTIVAYELVSTGVDKATGSKDNSGKNKSSKNKTTINKPTTTTKPPTSEKKNDEKASKKKLKFSGKGKRTIMRGKSAAIGFKTSPGRKK